jgi:hypothetical protein
VARRQVDGRAIGRVGMSETDAALCGECGLIACRPGEAVCVACDPALEVLDLYHRTTPHAAAAAYARGRMQSRENTGEVYFSTRLDGQAVGYGSGVVHVRVPGSLVDLEDEFPDGERHYRIRAGDLAAEHFLPPD